MDPAQLAAYEVDGLRPAAVAKPGTAEEAAELVRLAVAEKFAIVATGARTKLGIGMPPRRYDLAMDMTRLNRIVACDWGDLTLGVEAGCPLADLQKALAEHQQFLPLDLPYLDADDDWRRRWRRMWTRRCGSLTAGRGIMWWAWNSSPAMEQP